MGIATKSTEDTKGGVRQRSVGIATRSTEDTKGEREDARGEKATMLSRSSGQWVAGIATKSTEDTKGG